MGKLQLQRDKKNALLTNGGWLDCTHHEQYPKLLMNQEICTRKTCPQLAEKFRTKTLIRSLAQPVDDHRQERHRDLRGFQKKANFSYLLIVCDDSSGCKNCSATDVAGK